MDEKHWKEGSASLTSNSNKIFIMEDFNSRIGNTTIPDIMQRLNEDHENEDKLVVHNELQVGHLR